jgi:ABC-type branched-subunit amino acid transport system substrate-binding protein
MKKQIMATLSVVALGSLAACGGAASTSGGDSGGDGGASDEPIKVALIPPSSGALAQYGTDAVKGWKIAVEQVNADGGLLGGREVELVEKSTDADPATTLREARAAVQQDGAKFIGAVMTSTEHGALNAQLEGLGALSFNALGKDDGLIGEQCSPNAFHIVQTNGMDVNGLAESLGDIEGDKWAVQAVDYSTGHAAAEAFTEAAEAAGDEVVLEEYAPLNTTDFGSSITKLQDSDADALFVAEYGADGVAFVKQAQQFNLDEKFKSVVSFNVVSEPLFPVIGDATVGWYSNVGYDASEDNELNTEFVSAYEEEHGTKPYYVPADNYLAAQTLFAGIEEAGSDDPAEVAEALNDLSFDSIAGEVTLRGDDHQLLRPSYMGQVTGKGKDLAFDILSKTEADVTTPEPNADCQM